MAKAAAGRPTRFITLTVNPRMGTDPDSRLLLLANAWRNAAKRLRRLYPNKPFSYLAIVEATKAGEPHLHILYRGPFLPQKWLSSTMADLIGSPIVDIRRIRNTHEIIRYVAKYVTKAPHHFGTSKRYWCTQDWETPVEPKEDSGENAPPGWHVVQVPLMELLIAWAHEGYATRREGLDGVYGEFVDHPPW